MWQDIWTNIKKYTYLYGPGFLKKVIDFILYILKVMRDAAIDGIKTIFGASQQ